MYSAVTGVQTCALPISLKLKEKEISDKLIEKYGSSTIDLSTGNIL
jgi:hypothetical protein